MQLEKQSWSVHGGLSYGTPTNTSTVNCWSSMELSNSEASTETVNEQYFRADITGAGFTGAGSLSTCFSHVVMNSAGQSSGSIYGTRCRFDNTAGTITSATGVDVLLGSNAADQTVTAFMGLQVTAPSNLGTIGA